MRLTSRIEKLARAIRSYLELGLRVGTFDEKKSELLDEIVDRIELALFSASEHVDDIECICRTFFESDREYSKSSKTRLLKNAIKPIRDKFAAYANFIKHSHNRIHIFESQLNCNSQSYLTPGFFLEHSDGEKIGPNRKFHGQNPPIISLSTLLWQLIIYSYDCSDILGNFVRTFENFKGQNEFTAAEGHESLAKRLGSVLEIPLYHFDETHPFNNHKVRFLSLDKANISGFPGSPGNNWGFGEEDPITIGPWASGFNGDGVTKTFDIVVPKKITAIEIV